jgi:hypothetical protein
MAAIFKIICFLKGLIIMNIRKIITVLTIVGLSSITSAEEEFGATPGDTLDTKIRVCNTYEDFVIFGAKTEADTPVVLTSAPVRLTPSTCGDISLRSPTGEKNIPAVNISVSRLSNDPAHATYLGGYNIRIDRIKGDFTIPLKSVTKILTISNITKLPGLAGEKNYIFMYAVNFDRWKATLTQHLLQPSAGQMSFRNISGGLSPDFVLCAGPKKSVCNDSINMQ